MTKPNRQDISSRRLKAIGRLRDKYGDKIQMLSDEYVSQKGEVQFLCMDHGVFISKMAVVLKSKYGCPTCGKERKAENRIDTARRKFIDNAVGVHGLTYDYSKCDYVGSTNKVTIICPRHGEFRQTASTHLKGCGCPKCGREKQHKSTLLGLQEFILRARMVHMKEEYDYSEFVYVRNDVKGAIRCKRHGKFEQTAADHLLGRGCPKCGHEKMWIDRRMDTEKFICKALIKHNGKYDYSSVEYIKSDEKVVIICPEHGDFRQIPENHLAGKGCPSCAVTGYQPSKPGILYYLRVSTSNQTLYKIGITNRSLKERFSLTDLESITTIATWEYADGTIPPALEKEVLDEFANLRYQGDSVLSSGNTELFIEDVLCLDTAST